MNAHLIAALVLIGAAPAAAADPNVVVAVADFDVSNSVELAPLGKGLAEMLITDLSVSDSIRLVERARLRDVLGELALQKSPYFDPKSAAQLGHGLGAELIVTGQLFAEGNKLRLDVRAIDVETAEVVYAGKVEGAKEKIFELQRELATLVLAGLGAKLTPIAGKQLGKRGTKSFDALAHYGAALDAEDRGSAVELKKELALALKADPEFAVVRDRLNALEERVGSLEKSGGLILQPTSWRDHLHNFKTHRSKADLTRAEKSLVQALELEPRRAELWTSFIDLPLEHRRRAVDEARTLDAASKRLLLAHLSVDLGAIQSAPESRENPALRSVLAIDLIGRRLSAYTLSAAVELAKATTYVLDTKNRRFVESMLVDEEAFYSLARRLQQEKLAGREPPERALEGMIESAKFGSGGGASSSWAFELILVERPAGPIEVRVARVPLPAGEKPYPNEGLWEWKRDTPEDPKRQAALRAGSAYGWYVKTGDDPFSRDGIKGFTTFGQSFQIPAEDRFAECEPETRSPTGLQCQVLFMFDKVSMEPGPYELEVRYKDVLGAEAHFRDPQFWIAETTLSEFKTGLWRHADPSYFINPIDDKVRAKIDPSGKFPKAAAMVARVCANRPITDGKKSPVETFHYDFDSTVRDQNKTSHRASLISKGFSTKPLEDNGCGYLPLPKLAPGKHTICVVARRNNHSFTLAPECAIAEVPEHYPQEGRTPK